MFARGDGPGRLSGPLVVQTQQWDEGEGQARERRRHYDQRIETAVEQVLVEK